MIQDISDLLTHTIGLHQNLIQYQIEKKFPHFQIEGFLKIKQKVNMTGDELDNIQAYQEYYKQQNLVVFDSLRQRKIMIVVYITAFIKDNELREIQHALENFRHIDHIFLELYDRYFLSEDKNYYAVEMEWCEMTMSQFQQEYQINNQKMDLLMRCLPEYLNEQYDYNKQNFKNLSLELYFKIVDKSKIIAKINILSLTNEEKYSHIYSFVSSFQHQFYIKVGEEGKNQQLKIFQQQFIELQGRLSQQIPIETFQEEIKQSYSYLLDNYNLDLFERISKHPKYKTIQVKSYLNNCQQFIVDNNKYSQLILEVYKTNSYEETRQLQQKFQQQSIPNMKNAKFNIINIDVLPSQKESYILVEKQLFQTQLIQQRNKENSLRQNFIILKNMIILSQDLLAQNDLQITNINPYLIFIDDNNSQKDPNSFEVQIVIDQLISNRDYKQAYLKLVDEIFEVEKGFYTEPEINKIVFYQLIQQYFNTIQQKEKERACQLYLSIQQHLEILELNITYFNKNVKIINGKINQLSLELDYQEIETLTQLFAQVNNHNNVGSPIQISQICTDQNLKDIIALGEQLQFQVIKFNTSYYDRIEDISFLNLEIFKSVKHINLDDFCKLQLKQFNEFKNINIITIFQLIQKQKKPVPQTQNEIKQEIKEEKIEKFQLFKLKYIVSLNYKQANSKKAKNAFHNYFEPRIKSQILLKRRN